MSAPRVRRTTLRTRLRSTLHPRRLAAVALIGAVSVMLAWRWPDLRDAYDELFLPFERRFADETIERWFLRREARLDAVRAMLDEDAGRLTSLSQAAASGARGSCGASVRSGAFPWGCDDGTVAHDLHDVERWLDLPRGRLASYRRLAPWPIDKRGDVVAFSLTGTGGPWSKRVLWSPVAPAPIVADTLREGPRDGPAYRRLHRSWFIQRGGTRP